MPFDDEDTGGGECLDNVRVSAGLFDLLSERFFDKSRDEVDTAKLSAFVQKCIVDGLKREDAFHVTQDDDPTDPR